MTTPIYRIAEPVKPPYTLGPDILTPFLLKRFWKKVSKQESGCWLWTAHKNRYGYGTFAINKRPHAAHRVSVVIHGRDIPRDLECDHMCRNRACVNPEHIRLVTHAINSVENSNTVSAINAAKTHCHKGHPFSGENLRIGRRGNRVCRTCKRINERMNYAKRVQNF